MNLLGLIGKFVVRVPIWQVITGLSGSAWQFELLSVSLAHLASILTAFFASILTAFFIGFWGSGHTLLSAEIQ
jgi:hypothetical protein